MNYESTLFVVKEAKPYTIGRLRNPVVHALALVKKNGFDKALSIASRMSIPLELGNTLTNVIKDRKKIDAFWVNVYGYLNNRGGNKNEKVLKRAS